MKPRFKLTLDGRMTQIDVRLYLAMRRVEAQSSEPLTERPDYAMRGGQRFSDVPEHCLRRQIVRAFGDIRGFMAASGVTPSHMNILLKPHEVSSQSCLAAQLKRRFGLPVTVRKESR